MKKNSFKFLCKFKCFEKKIIARKSIYPYKAQMPGFEGGNLMS